MMCLMQRRTFQIRCCFALVACGASLLAQDPRIVINNDQVKVLKVPVVAHEKTKLHQHTANRVMIYLQAGQQSIDYQNGKKVVLNWKPGEALWSPAAGMHIAEVTSDKPVTIVEVELKKPAA